MSAMSLMSPMQGGGTSRRRRLAAAGLGLLALLASGCADGLAGGSGSGTGNSIAVAVVLPNGDPAAGVALRLRREAYVQSPDPEAPSDSLSEDGVTDAGGRLMLDSLPAGAYVVEAIGAGSGALQRFDIGTPKGTNLAATFTLRPLGAVTGEVRVEGERTGKAWVQVEGLERLATLDSGRGAFAFRDLPAGSYTFRVAFRHLPSDSLPDGIPALENVTVRSGETTAAPVLIVPSPYPAWKRSATLTLNTTAAGAAVSGDVAGFPLLVRLDSDGFPFAEAAGDGRDLRFAKADGAPLAFEVERWDSAQGRAEVWVALDTVFGDRDSQSLRMYWGNAEAASRSSGGAVFDTARGFRAVWHLDEDKAGAGGAGSAGVYRDATLHGFHGLDSVAAAGKEGAVGRGQAFDGLTDYVRIPGAIAKFGTEPFTLSLWVKVAGPAGALLGHYSPDGDWSHGEVAYYFGDGNYITGSDGGGQCRDGRVAPGRCVNGRFPSLVGFSRSYTVADAEVGVDAWHHLALSWDGGAATAMYLDGKAMGLAVQDFQAGSDSAAFDFYLGKPNGLESIAYFKGSMDEVRVCRIARDTHWIRLAFESQRPDSRLIRISRP